MIIFGSRGRVVDLARRETHACRICGQNRQFHTQLQYRYVHVYYLFGVVTRKQYWTLCDVCRKGWVLESKQVEANLGKVPIPFMQRFGLLSLAGMMMIVVSLAAISGH
jgi:hypothetical protein